MLREGFQALAATLQESSDVMGHKDVRAHLQTAIQQNHPDQYPYLVDHTGDGESGDCVYCMGNDYMQAPYEMSQSGGMRKATVGTPSKVMPRTVYDPVPSESDWVASMEALTEAERKLAKQPGVARILFFERFVSKSERDAAKSSDFAGKGKSFPILKPEDIDAAFRSLGRAGSDNYSAAVIRANIVKIAKAKGWASHLPASAQNESASEAARDVEVAGEFVSLREGAIESNGKALVKLIAPGWGSSGYYSKEMLKRDLPKAFRKGTKMYWNHQTAAEEAARPEGNLDDVASVLAEDAHYDESGPLGPGGYAYADTVEHYRPAIQNLAKHMGVSIRARGTAKEGEAEGKKGMLINSLTQGLSVDYVTEAGAGGKIVSLFEAARPQIREAAKENDMDKTEVQALIESAVTPLKTDLAATKTENAALKESNVKVRQRLALTEAAGEADRILKDLSLHEGVRDRVKSRVLAGVIPLTEAGDLDVAKLKEKLEAEAKDEAAYVQRLTESGTVRGMGAPLLKDTELTEADYSKEMVASFMATGMSEAAAKIAAKGGVN